MKKIISVILCILMISLLPTAAWADTASGAAQTAANTAALKNGSIDSGNAVPVSANLSATQLSFEISESITAVTQTADDPTILTYSSLTIENKMQTGALQVDRISATAAGDYSLTAEPINSDTYWKGLAVDSKQFSMRISCSSKPAVNNHDLASSSLTKRPTINTGTSITYTFDGHTGISSTAFNGKIAQLVVTVSLKVVEPTPALKLSTATASGLSFKIEKANAKWEGTLETSVDGKTWQTYTAGTTVTADVDKNVIYIRGKDNTVITGSSACYKKPLVIGGTNVSVSGDLNALLDYESVEEGNEPSTVGNGAFCSLFKDNTNIIDAQDLKLSLSTVGEEVYRRLFHGCTSLASAPEEISATIVKEYGCAEMFYNSKIVSAPLIRALNLSGHAFLGTFSNCKKLTNVQQELPATKLDAYCYNGMFISCTSLETAPKLPATTLAVYCYNYMFQGCTALKNTQEVLPALHAPQDCYRSMFKNCTALEIPPKLPATKVDSMAYAGMFWGCSSLKSLPQLPATQIAQKCYENMFNGCKAIKLSATQTGAYTTAYRIPSSGEITYIWYDTEAEKDYTEWPPFTNMFANTGGAFTGEPDIKADMALEGNTSATYYTSNDVLR